MWGEQIPAQGGEAACLGEVSREAMFGSLREGSTVPGCQVGKMAHTEGSSWTEA